MNQLAEALRTETKALHVEVERGPLMRSLLRGEMGTRDYATLLRNFHALYVALEGALEQNKDHPSVAPIYFPELFRTEQLARDLETIYGPGWREELTLQPTALSYADHLTKLKDERPALLVAHAYVRYLGDLNGGQMLKRIVADAMKLPAGSGTAFYEFGDKARTAELLQKYRAGLGAVPAGESDVAAIAREAKHAFELHRSLFSELAANTES